MLFFFFLGQFSVTLRPEGQATIINGKALKLTCLSTKTGGSLKFFYSKDNRSIDMAYGGGSFNGCINYFKNESTFSCNFTTEEYVLTLNSPVHNRTIFCSISWNRSTVIDKTTVFVQGILTHICIVHYIKHLMITLNFILTVI